MALEVEKFVKGKEICNASLDKNYLTMDTPDIPLLETQILFWLTSTQSEKNQYGKHVGGTFYFFKQERLIF